VAALFVAAGYAAGALRGRLAVEHWPVAALAVGFLTVAFEGARGLLGAVEGWTWPAALLTLAGTGLYNAALACPACALLRRGRSLLPGAAPAA
jgi:hypothetical protein